MNGFVKKIAVLAAVLLLGVGGFSFLVSRPRGKAEAKKSAAAPVLPGPTVDVRAYGAVCDGKTDDTAADLAAWNAVCAAGGGTLVTPGLSAVSAGFVTPPGFQGHVCVRGTSQAAGFALLANVGYLFDFELGAGPNGGAGNVADVQDLAFVSNGFSGTAPFKIAYGVIPSSENNSGPNVRNIRIEGAGWTGGATFVNAWHVRVLSIYGRGNPANFDGPTGGSLVSFTGQCINETICQVQGDFWRSGISAVATPGTSFQGFQISNVNLVQCPYALSFDGSAGVANGAIQITNAQVDNGNTHAQTHGYGLWATGVSAIVLNNFVFPDNSQTENPIYLNGCDDFTISDGQAESDGFFHTPASISLIDCGGGKIHDLEIGGSVDDITLDANCSANTIYGCHQPGQQFVRVLDEGFNNCIGDTRGFSAVYTLTGGQASETFYLNTLTCSMAKKPAGASVSVSSDNYYEAHYNWDDVGNTATQIAVVISPRNGGLTGAGNGVRITATTGPSY